MGVNNACDVMQAAVTFQQDELRQTALEYIESNTSVRSISLVSILFSFHQLSAFEC